MVVEVNRPMTPPLKLASLLPLRVFLLLLKLLWRHVLRRQVPLHHLAQLIINLGVELGPLCRLVLAFHAGKEFSCFHGYA